MAKSENVAEKEKKIKGYLWVPIILLALLVFSIFFIITVRLFTPEDNWICENGSWVKHGNPSAPAPTLECRTTGVENRSQQDKKREGNQSTGIFSATPITDASKAVNSLPDENVVGPVQISGFFRFISPVVNLAAIIGAKVCTWGRPKELAYTCPSIKANFQNAFNEASK